MSPDLPASCLLSGVVRRRTVLHATGAGIGLWWVAAVGGRRTLVEAAVRAGTPALLPATAIPQWVTPLPVPSVMPVSGRVVLRDGRTADTYDVAVRQVVQQVLPPPLPATTVWAYGPASVRSPGAPRVFAAPSPTIEAAWGRPVRVTWRNQLVDASGAFLPHLLPVDPTLHWANPPGGPAGRDSRPAFDTVPGPYRGPVPLVTHVHGAVGVGDESDGYPEAWYLPDAADIPAGYAREGTWYDFLRAKARAEHDVVWEPGSATAQYENDQRATTLWYHDHALGLTRANVYAGPAGFYLVRGGPEGDDAVLDARTGGRAVLPGPARKAGDPPQGRQPCYEIPLAIQDRTFCADGSLFYPDSRLYFDEVAGPYVPVGDVPPIWNPEFFGTTIMVNGATWPTLTVEQRRYRLRLLNGCDSRFLLLDLGALPGARAWQIGSDGGFLPAPVDLATHAGRLLLAPAERADVVLDLTDVPTGAHVLRNLGPDEPFGGGEPDGDFDSADPATTGSVLQLVVVPARGTDRSTPPEHLVLPAVAPLERGTVRRLALVEQMSAVADGAPVAALLGTVDATGVPVPAGWDEPVTENPAAGTVETWELVNTTADAHPIHVHEVAFQVADREPVAVDEVSGRVTLLGGAREPEANERGWKDTVVAYPGEVTRIRMRFPRAGQYVWHCHILEHEDNEMMRPYRIGPAQPGQPPDGDGAEHH